MRETQTPPAPRSFPVFAALLFGIASASDGLCAPIPNPEKPAPLSNRYLFIVETSRSMQRRADGALQAVQDLLDSGMKGQLRAGDTLGLWTFNDDLYAGQFPLQRWSPETQKAITARAVTFLREQKFEKPSSLEKVYPTLKQVLQDSEFITVILISSGEEPIHGTPFDNKINEHYKAWRDEQSKARMPFVVVLRAKVGKIADYSVNPAPWGVEMPPLPQELLRDRDPASVAQPSQRSGVPPLIFTGKQPSPAPATTQAGPAAVRDEAHTTSSLTETSKSPDPLATPAPVSAKPLEPLPPANVEPAPAPSTTATKTQPANRELPKAIPANADSSTSGTVTVIPADSTANPPSSTLDTLSSVPAPPVQGAVAIPPKTFFSRRNLAIAGGLAAAVALVFVFLAMRRPAPSSRISLITRSLDRENK